MKYPQMNLPAVKVEPQPAPGPINAAPYQEPEFKTPVRGMDNPATCYLGQDKFGEPGEAPYAKGE